MTSPKSKLAQYLRVIHPTVPLTSVSLSQQSKVLTLTFTERPPQEALDDLIASIKKHFTSLYQERLVCSFCMTRIVTGQVRCGDCGNNRLLQVPDTFSSYPTANVAGKIHRRTHRPCADAQASRVASILTAADDVSKRMAGLSLSGSPPPPPPSAVRRRPDVEASYCSIMNGLPMKTVLRQRVKGYKRRPLSLSASKVTSVEHLRELAYEFCEARVMSADTKRESAVYDTLLDEIGAADEFVDWGRADGREATFDFGEFGTVPMRGSPDGTYKSLPVELKTVVSSIRHGASSEKIRSWALQVASYQKTHGSGSASGITPAILLVVSIKDGDVLALEIPPSNHERACVAWRRNLAIAYGGNHAFALRYWKELIRYLNLPRRVQVKKRVETLRSVASWQNQDAVRLTEEGLACMSGVWEREGAAAFVSKIGAGRKLVKKGMRGWEWKRDRHARALINRIKAETRELFERSMALAVSGFEGAKKKSSEGGSVANVELKAILQTFALVRVLAQWRENNKEVSIVDAAIEDIKKQAKSWKISVEAILPADVLLEGDNGKDEDEEGDAEEEEEQIVFQAG